MVGLGYILRKAEATGLPERLWSMRAVGGDSDTPIIWWRRLRKTGWWLETGCKLRVPFGHIKL